MIPLTNKRYHVDLPIKRINVDHGIPMTKLLRDEVIPAIPIIVPEINLTSMEVTSSIDKSTSTFTFTLNVQYNTLNFDASETFTIYAYFRPIAIALLTDEEVKDVATNQLTYTLNFDTTFPNSPGSIMGEHPIVALQTRLEAYSFVKSDSEDIYSSIRQQYATPTLDVYHDMIVELTSHNQSVMIVDVFVNSLYGDRYNDLASVEASIKYDPNIIYISLDTGLVSNGVYNNIRITQTSDNTRITMDHHDKSIPKRFQHSGDKIHVGQFYMFVLNNSVSGQSYFELYPKFMRTSQYGDVAFPNQNVPINIPSLPTPLSFDAASFLILNSLDVDSPISTEAKTAFNGETITVDFQTYEANIDKLDAYFVCYDDIGTELGRYSAVIEHDRTTQFEIYYSSDFTIDTNTHQTGLYNFEITHLRTSQLYKFQDTNRISVVADRGSVIVDSENNLDDALVVGILTLSNSYGRPYDVAFNLYDSTNSLINTFVFNSVTQSSSFPLSHTFNITPYTNYKITYQVDNQVDQPQTSTLFDGRSKGADTFTLTSFVFANDDPITYLQDGDDIKIEYTFNHPSLDLNHLTVYLTNGDDVEFQVDDTQIISQGTSSCTLKSTHTINSEIDESTITKNFLYPKFVFNDTTSTHTQEFDINKQYVDTKLPITFDVNVVGTANSAEFEVTSFIDPGQHLMNHTLTFIVKRASDPSFQSGEITFSNVNNDTDLSTLRGVITSLNQGVTDYVLTCLIEDELGSQSYHTFNFNTQAYTFRIYSMSDTVAIVGSTITIQIQYNEPSATTADITQLKLTDFFNAVTHADLTTNLTKLRNDATFSYFETTFTPTSSHGDQRMTLLVSSSQSTKQWRNLLWIDGSVGIPTLSLRKVTRDTAIISLDSFLDQGPMNINHTITVGIYDKSTKTHIDDVVFQYVNNATTFPLFGESSLLSEGFTYDTNVVINDAFGQQRTQSFLDITTPTLNSITSPTLSFSNAMNTSVDIILETFVDDDPSANHDVVVEAIPSTGGLPRPPPAGGWPSITFNNISINSSNIPMTLALTTLSSNTLYDVDVTISDSTGNSNTRRITNAFQTTS